MNGFAAAPGEGCLRCTSALDRVRGIAGDAVATCARCGRDWLRLPLFAVGGATGVGKTTATEPLTNLVPECVRLDGDLLWRHEYLEDDAALATFYRTWLRLAVELHQSGRPLVFSGNAWPEWWEPLPERAYLSEIHYLVLVCEPAVHERRLRSRGPGSMDSYYFPRVMRHNEWLRANAEDDPRVDVLDTTALDASATTAAIAGWIRERLP